MLAADVIQAMPDVKAGTTLFVCHCTQALHAFFTFLALQRRINTPEGCKGKLLSAMFMLGWRA